MGQKKKEKNTEWVSKSADLCRDRHAVPQETLGRPRKDRKDRKDKEEDQ